jgi:hypothetical protein
MFENIERIPMPPVDVFFRDYVLKHRPVIITNLFADQPIAKIQALPDAEHQLGAMKVVVTPGFEQFIVDTVRTLVNRAGNFEFQQRPSTVREYLEHVTRHPETKDMCSEVPGPIISEVQALYEIPPYCRTADGAVDDEYRAELWMANAGNTTHLHFDADQRQILQYQLFGTKRVILIPPSGAKKLAPVRNNCAISPAGISDAEKDEFVRYVGGYQCLLRGGETIFMPALIWHYLEYVDTSMSLSMRFWRNPYSRFLAEECHPDYHLQAFAWRLIDPASIEPDDELAFRQIEELARKPLSSPAEKGQQMQALYEEIYARRCGDQPRGRYARPFVDELAGMIQQIEFDMGPYSRPVARN